MVLMASMYRDNEHSSSSDSDYNVEEYISAKRVRRTVNDESGDLLGNFNDAKRQEILAGTYVEPYVNASDAEDDEVDDSGEQRDSRDNSDSETATDADATASAQEAEVDESEAATTSEMNTNLSKEQLASLLQGTAKKNRHVLYVTNLNFDSSQDDLEAHFKSAGTVKSVRIPRKRRGGFAFVEMADIEGFQRAFQLHNTELMGFTIKVQFSEAGKKKSANKKNIIKQKNRKLAKMRNEKKTFTKSGKFFDKTLKKEKAKEMLARKRWRKKPAA